MTKKIAVLSVFSMMVVVFAFALSSCSFKHRSGDFYYKVEDGEATITLYVGEDEHVVVPESLDGNPVVAIGRDAFYACDRVRSVTLPDSVASIGSESFGYCHALERVNLGNGIREIDQYAFYDSEGMVFNEYENGYYLGNEETPFLALISVRFKDVEAFTIHPDAVTISENAFEACTLLREIVIPEGVTAICDEAFSFCSSLETVYIPQSVETLYSTSFLKCESLVEFVVPDKNPYFKSVNGVLFSRDGTRLIKYAAGKKDTLYRVADGTVKMEAYAFQGANNLTEVVLPDSIEQIEKGSFWGCENLEKISLGNSLKGIGETAFYNCDSLTEIVVPDSVEQIGERAFAYSDTLETVTIGSSVTNMNSAAFSGCVSLREVIFRDPEGWRVDRTKDSPRGKIDLSDPKKNAQNFTGEYAPYQWRKKTYFYEYFFDLFS